jgi:quercetin dioxygenase-like cupin family protein
MRQNVYRHDQLEETEIRPGLRGTIIEGDDTTLVRWSLKAGTPQTRLHEHPEHEQYGLLISGRLQMSIEGEQVELRPGDMYWVPPGTEHGATLVLGDEDAVLLDIFSPPREDYVAAARDGVPTDPTSKAS